MIKLKKAPGKGDSPPSRKPRMQARMRLKPAMEAGAADLGDKKVEMTPSKTLAKRNAAAAIVEPAFPADFFAVMGEMDKATEKRRTAAVKLMQKAAAKK